MKRSFVKILLLEPIPFDALPDCHDVLDQFFLLQQIERSRLDSFEAL